MVNTLWQHKVEKADAEKIIKAVLVNSGCERRESLAKIEANYQRDRSEQLQGLPSLADEFHWSEDEVKDFKKLLFKITGRDALPEYTNTSVERIAI